MTRPHAPASLGMLALLCVAFWGLHAAGADLEFQTGPVLGPAGQDYFTLCCRTSLPAKVQLAANGTSQESPSGLIHFFRVSGLKPASRCECVLTAEVPGTQTRKTVKIEGRTLPEKAPFTFAVVGDNRTKPRDWTKVSDEVASAKPVFIVHTGDLVSDGRKDELWDREYFGPARKMLSTAPVFPVLGNHDASSPVFHRFYGGTEQWKNWVLKAGPVLFIGIDGGTDWAAASKNVRWLDGVLSASDEPFIFLASHYPAWSSGPHGSLKDGVPSERAVREAQQVILPLLQKYHATAFFAGHDHFYEHSEVNGLSMIVTGGAGAPRYSKTKNEQEQNPHSKVFHSKLHYCLVDVTEQQCKLRALTPEGALLDTFQWAARPVAAGVR